MPGTYSAVGPGSSLGTVHVDLPPVAPLDLGALCIEMRESSNVTAISIKDLNATLDKLCGLLCIAVERPAAVVHVASVIPEIHVVAASQPAPVVNVEARPGTLEMRVVEEPGPAAPMWPTVSLLVLVAAHLALAAWPMLRGAW